MAADSTETDAPASTVATFGAGCFWQIEAAYRMLPGVTATTVGYMGGSLSDPTYRDVCTDHTGHAEVVQVEWDPSRLTYDGILDAFWANHDPTTLNRQGPDIGTQYRSAIFYHDEAQRAAALASKQRLETEGRYRRQIVTEITAASEFWPAEDYHQQYLEKRGLASCSIELAAKA